MTVFRKITAYTTVSLKSLFVRVYSVVPTCRPYVKVKNFLQCDCNHQTVKLSICCDE